MTAEPWRACNEFTDVIPFRRGTARFDGLSCRSVGRGQDIVKTRPALPHVHLPLARRVRHLAQLLSVAARRAYFLIPGKRETLRIGVSGGVVRDAALLESMNAQGKIPALAIAVSASAEALCSLGVVSQE